MPATAPPPSASRYYATSAVAASAAARAASVARPRGLRAAWEVVARFQVAQARVAPAAVDAMLGDQGVSVEPVGVLNPLAFTTPLSGFDEMVAALEAEVAADVDRLAGEVQAAADREFERLVASIVQDAGRAAESVAVAARPGVAHVRYLSPPSCSRCTVLAGRVYRYSEGFQRHPGCDCVMVPVTVASPDFTQDVDALVASGQVTGLSKADRRAVADGADLGRVVNVRRRAAGLRESGRVLYRAGLMTPEAIYRRTGDDRDAAVELLRANGYVR